MLGSFILHGLTQQEAESESLLQIMAGADSTATAIRCTFLLSSQILSSMANYEPRSKKGLVKARFLTQWSNSQRQATAISASVHYGRPENVAAIDRLQSKVAPSSGETVNGIFTPGGVEVAFNPTMTMRRKDIFGDDSNVFRPERWVDADESTRNKYERTTESVVDSGRYGCLGKNIAMMELNKVLVEVRSKPSSFCG